MKVTFSEIGWVDYVYWQSGNRKMLDKINRLISDIGRNSYSGIGKPERLKGDLTGWWSRRIDKENRLVYRILEDGSTMEISRCKGHYDD